jgi:hypothetical protein
MVSVFLYDVINIWLFGWRVARLYIDGNAVSKPPADNFQKFSLNSGYIHDGKKKTARSISLLDFISSVDICGAE